MSFPFVNLKSDIHKLLDSFGTRTKDATTTGTLLGSNLSYFNLLPKAEELYPVLTFYGDMPKYDSGGGTAVNWKAVVALGNPSSLAIGEGNRGIRQSMTTRDVFSTIKYFGLEGNVTMAAQEAGKSFDDNLAKGQTRLLKGTMLQFDRQVLYGNSGASNLGFALGQANTPTVADNAAVGSLTPTGTLKVAVVALTAAGLDNITATGVTPVVSTTDALGNAVTFNGGTSAISAMSALSTVGSGKSSQLAKVAPTKGAVAYAWYVGSAPSTIADLKFAGITSVAQFLILAIPSTGQAGNATDLNADHSVNAQETDGILTAAFNSGYAVDLAGAQLTPAGNGRVVEIDAMLANLWATRRISPTRLDVGGNTLLSLMNAIAPAVAGSTLSVITQADLTGVTAGFIPGGYMNPYNGKRIPIRPVAILPQGVILADLNEIPDAYLAADIPAARRLAVQRDWFSMMWPFRRLEHEFGVYLFGAMEHHMPFGYGVITGIGQ